MNYNKPLREYYEETGGFHEEFLTPLYYAQDSPRERERDDRSVKTCVLTSNKSSQKKLQYTCMTCSLRTHKKIEDQLFEG